MSSTNTSLFSGSPFAHSQNSQESRYDNPFDSPPISPKTRSVLNNNKTDKNPQEINFDFYIKRADENSNENSLPKINVKLPKNVEYSDSDNSDSEDFDSGRKLAPGFVKPEHVSDPDLLAQINTIATIQLEEYSTTPKKGNPFSSNETFINQLKANQNKVISKVEPREELSRNRPVSSPKKSNQHDENSVGILSVEKKIKGSKELAKTKVQSNYYSESRLSNTRQSLEEIKNEVLNATSPRSLKRLGKDTEPSIIFGEEEQLIVSQADPLSPIFASDTPETHFVLDKLSKFLGVNTGLLKTGIREINQEFIEKKFNFSKEYSSLLSKWVNQPLSHFFKVYEEKVSVIKNIQSSKTSPTKKTDKVISPQNTPKKSNTFVSLFKHSSKRASIEAKSGIINQVDSFVEKEPTQTVLEVTTEGMKLIVIILKSLVSKNSELKFNLNFDSLAHKIEGGWKFLCDGLSLPQVNKLVISKHSLAEEESNFLKEVFIERRKIENSQLTIEVESNNNQHLINYFSNRNELADLIADGLFIF